MWNFPVQLKEEDNGFVVTFPDIPEAITQGENREEALLYAQEALESVLSFYIEEQRDLPIPSPTNGSTTVSPTALECAKLSLYLKMAASSQAPDWWCNFLVPTRQRGNPVWTRQRPVF